MLVNVTKLQICLVYLQLVRWVYGPANNSFGYTKIRRLTPLNKRKFVKPEKTPNQKNVKKWLTLCSLFFQIPAKLTVIQAIGERLHTDQVQSNKIIIQKSWSHLCQKRIFSTHLHFRQSQSLEFRRRPGFSSEHLVHGS